MAEHQVFETPLPTCPHCGYALDHDDMASGFGSMNDLYAIAPQEETAVIHCPQCDQEYAVRGGYKPHYTSAFSLDEL